jgi:cysteinyl-tRNA synthetase
MGDREAARLEKRYGDADRIRNQLLGMGILLKDSKDPATGKLTTTWEKAS